jgi:hypothetical protein
MDIVADEETAFGAEGTCTHDGGWCAMDNLWLERAAAEADVVSEVQMAG